MMSRYIHRIVAAGAILAASGTCAGADTLVTGSMIVNISAVNKSKIPTNADVRCGLSWQARSRTDNSFSESRFYLTKALITATTISCKVVVPYAVTVVDPSLVDVDVSANLTLGALALAASEVLGTSADAATKAVAVSGSTIPTRARVPFPSFGFPLPPDNTIVTRNFVTAM